MPATEPTPDLTVVFVTADDVTDTLLIGRFDSPIGRLVAIGAEGTLWAVGVVGEMGESAVLNDLLRRLPHARLVEAPEALAPAVESLLRGRGEVRVHVTGTPFQLAVWRALTGVPAGQVISYATLADRIGHPAALRAVGTAVGQNPVAWAIPCHRVTRKSGAIGGYRWGVSVKRALLAREGAVVAQLAIAEM